MSHLRQLDCDDDSKVTLGTGGIFEMFHDGVNALMEGDDLKIEERLMIGSSTEIFTSLSRCLIVGTDGSTEALTLQNDSTANTGNVLTHKWYFNHDGSASSAGREEYVRVAAGSVGIVENSETAFYNILTRESGSLQIRVRVEGEDLYLGYNSSDKIGFFSATPTSRSTGWSTSGVSTDKVITVGDTLADTQHQLGSLVNELLSKGLIGA